MRSLQGKRVLICEEALKNESGHWYEYSKAAAGILKQAGAEVTVLGHRELSHHIADELNGLPYFQWTNWDGIYHHEFRLVRYLNIIRHNWRVWYAVSKYLKEHDGFDLVFVPTVVIYHLVAWRLLVLRFGGRKVRRVSLLIRNSSAQYHSGSAEPDYSASAGILAMVLRWFRKPIQQGILQITTDSHRLAEEYEKLSGIKPEVIPHPKCLSSTASTIQNVEPNHTLRICSPGPARWEKGIHVLLDALRLLKARTDIPKIHCSIQWLDTVTDPDGKVVDFEPSEFSSGSVTVEQLQNALSAGEYEKLLQNTDLVVLPYMRTAYYARISGVAVEAMLAGIPLIYTEDTWVADMVTKTGAGLGIQDSDAADLAGKILQFIDQRKLFVEQAGERAGLAREVFSERHFLEQLWGEQ